MFVNSAAFKTVRVVERAATMAIGLEELRAMAMFVVLQFIRNDDTTWTTPKQIAMIKELRDTLTASVGVSLTDDYDGTVDLVGLKDAKEAIDYALRALGIKE